MLEKTSICRCIYGIFWVSHRLHNSSKYERSDYNDGGEDKSDFVQWHHSRAPAARLE